MDFEFTRDQRDLRRRVEELARNVLDVGFEAREAAAEFPADAWRACAEFGLLGLPFPEAIGGNALGIVDAMYAMEGLGYACRDAGLVFGLNAQLWAVQMPLHLFGDDAIVDRYLVPMIRGERIGAYAMTEPESGSDAFGMRTTAVEDGDHYVLNGRKTFCTNATVADCFLVFAMTKPSAGFLGASVFLVDRDRPGLSVSAPIPKMGMRTSPMADVVLDDVRVPIASRLGKAGQGGRIFAATMAWERACLLGSHVGAMERQLETCVRYAKTRKQFGQPIGKFQAVAHTIANMKLRLETSRMMLYKVAWTKQRGEDASMDAALAKLHISESWVQSSLDAIQIHGGYGYTTEYGLERELRDAVGSRIYSGTNEIQRNVVARWLGLG